MAANDLRFPFPASSLSKSSWTIIGVCCALLAALWLVIAVAMSLVRAGEEESVRRETESAAAILAEQMERTLLSADLALRIAELELSRQPTVDVLARLQQNEQLALGPVSRISFINAEGRLVADQTGPDSNGWSVAHRSYFQTHRTGFNGLLVSAPVFGVHLREWIIPLTRRIEDSRGKMLGVVLGSLSPAYLARFWRQIDPQASMSLRLVDQQGRVYATTGDYAPMLEAGLVRPEDRDFVQGAAEGVAAQREVGARSVFSAFRQVAGTPLSVIVDQEPPPFWSEAARYSVLLGLWASGFMLLLAAWIWRVTTQLSAAEMRAVRSEARLRGAIDSMPDGFGIVDSNHRVVVMNAALRKFYPGPPEDLKVGADYFELRRKGRSTGRIRDENGQPLPADQDVLERDFVAPKGARLQRMDDRYVRIVEARTPTGDMVSIRTDITELKQREDELRKSRAILEAQARELKDMAAKAEAATQSKSAFVAAMSHEIRTPLNAIVGFGDLLSRADLPPEQKHFAAIIRDSSHHLLRLADDILDFERLGANKVILKNEPFDLVAGLYGIADVTVGLVGSRPIAVAVNVEPDVPERAVGDWLRLKQVLINLLGNAVKFTQDGEVELAVSRSDGDHIRFVVRDTGPGISEADRATIFDVFEQGAAGGARKGGSGLGLTIVRRLVALMGGEISVETKLGEGSAFSFDIPLPAARAVAVDLTQAGRPRRQAGRKRILLADDVASARLLLSTLLKMRGHDVVAVEDGLEALAAARAARFDCILLDFQMPNMDGLEAARLIRKLPPPNGGVPIFGFSAQVLEQDRVAAAAAGMNGFLPKPLREDALDRMLDSLDVQAAAPENVAAPASATMA